MAGQNTNQPGQRRDVNAVDQFGRTWCFPIEVRTGDPCSVMTLVTADGSGALVDPIRTPQKYVTIPRVAGQPVMGKIFVDLNRWARDHQEDDERWLQQLRENAQATYKKLEPREIPKLVEDPHLLSLTGPRPWPSQEVLKAAAKGYKPFLGLAPLSRSDREKLGELTYEDVVEEMEPKAGQRNAVAEGIPSTYPEFLAWAFKSGSAANLTDAAKLWQAHKKELNKKELATV
jgi:hypothetical protein